jgi:hypothetical protein
MVGGAPGGPTASPIGRTVPTIRRMTPSTCSQPGQCRGLQQPPARSPGAAVPVTSSTRQAARAQAGGCPAGTGSGRQEGGQAGQAITYRPTPPLSSGGRAGALAPGRSLYSRPSARRRAPVCRSSCVNSRGRDPSIQPDCFVPVRLPLTGRPLSSPRSQRPGTVTTTTQPSVTVAGSIGRKLSSGAVGFAPSSDRGRSGHLVRPGQPHRTERGQDDVGANQAAARVSTSPSSPLHPRGRGLPSATPR